MKHTMRARYAFAIVATSTAAFWSGLDSELAYAQDAAADMPAPTDATPTLRAMPEPDAAPSEPVAASPDLASDVATLRAEVDALKAKAEEAELAALMATSEDATAAAEAPPLRVYGFMDFGFDKFFMGDDDDGFGLLRPTEAGTFVFGNLNFYFDANPTENIRTLVELRYTTAPHGEELSLGPPLGTSYERTDTLAFDFSAPSAQTQLRLGGIFIERAWSQYQISELVKIQWGLFLNPFGIWNIDHGSPTLISLMLPTFVAAQMMPTRLLGVNVYGSTISGSTEIGYAVHITNGRSPLDFDLTEDKAIGARVYASSEGDVGRLVLGLSGYFGTYADVEKAIAIRPGNTIDWVTNVAYSEQVVGADVALDVGDLRLRSEAVLRWIQYDDGKHERIFSTDGSEQYLASRMEYAGYVMAAYRTPWSLEPYFEVELSSKSYVLPRFAGRTRATSSDVAAIVPSFGLNVEVTPQMLIKGQLAYMLAYDANFSTRNLDTFVAFVRVVNTF